MEKVKLMCSYGGKINHRPHDRQLSYIGGDTKILTIDRTINFTNLSSKLNALCDYSYEIRFKYKLPGLDLDALISVFDDDDVENMFFEYDLLRRTSAVAPPRLRLFVFFLPSNSPPPPAAAAEKSANPDFLFGFDTDYSLNYTAVLPPENVNRKEVVESPATVTVTDNRNVTRGGGGGYVFPAPFVYGAPMASGGYFGGGNREQAVVYGYIGGGNREQPVAYGYIPPVSVLEQGNIPVSGGPVSYDGSQHPTVMMGATCNHESKVVGSGAQHDA